ncbi:hypothetical protein [Kitasatospora phosalacinea]|uniref:Uncharacterized protein n=1 Tax=Kitasatospora phosalacinea TaxID=2065 RepID=A0ABW6GRC7_9ACTN
MSAIWWAIPAALAWIALHRINRELARTVALAATAVMWTATALAIAVTRS